MLDASISVTEVRFDNDCTRYNPQNQILRCYHVTMPSRISSSKAACLPVHVYAHVASTLNVHLEFALMCQDYNLYHDQLYTFDFQAFHSIAKCVTALTLVCKHEAEAVVSQFIADVMVSKSLKYFNALRLTVLKLVSLLWISFCRLQFHLISIYIYL